MHALRCALASTVDGKDALAAQVPIGAGSGGIQQLIKQTDTSASFYWLRLLAAFSYLQQMEILSQDNTVDGDGGGAASKLLDQLKLCKSIDEPNDTVQHLLLNKIAKHISVPAADISTDKPIHAYGVDSLVAVELCNWLSMERADHLRLDGQRPNKPGE